MLENIETVEIPAEEPQESGRLSLFMLFLSPLIVLMTTVSYVEGASRIVVYYGFICVIAFLFIGKIKFYKETIFFMLFLLWCLPGFLFTKSLESIFTNYTTLIQLFVLFLKHFQNHSDLILVLIHFVVLYY